MDTSMTTLALAVVATLGYLVGRRRTVRGNRVTARSRREVRRAQEVAQELEKIAWTFTEVRTDALTGIANRRGLDEALTGQLALMNRYDAGFSVAMFEIDHFKDVNDEQGHRRGDQTLQQVAQLLDESAREPDVVGRYGGEGFVVVMPRTDLQGACVFAERFRLRLHEELTLTVSAGVTAALDGDTADSIFSRADSALYQAKAAGRNRVFRHTGQQIEPIFEDVLAAAPEQ